MLTVINYLCCSNPTVPFGCSSIDYVTTFFEIADNARDAWGWKMSSEADEKGKTFILDTAQIMEMICFLG